MAAPARAQTADTLLAYSQLRGRIAAEGRLWGLVARPDGPIALRGKILSYAQVERLSRFFESVPPRQPDHDYYLVRALAAEMSCQGSALKPSEEGLAAMGVDEQWHLTPLGRNLLMDVLTAEDGVRFRRSRALEARLATLKPGKDMPRLSRDSAAALNSLFDGSLDAQRASDGRDVLNLAALREAGVDGSGVTLGFIDTGIDVSHPDLKGRITVYRDYTGKGRKDEIGHGTHVASLAAGDGSASGGRYAGPSPKANVAMFKVINDGSDYDKDPEDSRLQRTFEDRILAAMRDAAALPAALRPQVLNISLDGKSTVFPDPVTEMANWLVTKANILVVAAAGNSGPEKRTLGSPADGEHVLAVTGLDDAGAFADYTSRGPERAPDGLSILKPDLATYAGSSQETAGPDAGVIGAWSHDSSSYGQLAGQPAYRRMSGTSQASPLAVGAAGAAVQAVLAWKFPYRATETRALLMESAQDQQWDPVIQGQGVLDGKRLVALMSARLKAGVPVGNIACMLAMRLTPKQQKSVDASARFRRTGLGIVDAADGSLVNDDAALRRMIKTLTPVKVPVLPPSLQLPTRR